MPELPEVETIRRQFAAEVVGRSISSVDISLAKMIRGSSPVLFVRSVEGGRFIEARRRSKVLILDLSNGYSILVHLKLSGRLLHVVARTPVAKHTHVIFHLDDETDLRLTEMRQFGYLKLVKTSEVGETPEIKKLGPEALGLTLEDFRQALLPRPRSKVKAVLLDQSRIAGIGNIYADEILFRARIHPERPAASLTGQEISLLFDAMREILIVAIERRGTSVALYQDLHGEEGENQRFLEVYGRKGLTCRGCAGSVEKIKVAGRGTNYCPSCQR